MASSTLRWPIVAWGMDHGLPAAIVSERPAIASPMVPPEVGLMLPARADWDGLPTGPDIPAAGDDAAMGLFLTNPFLNLDQVIPRLEAASVGWVSNFPTIGFHDPEFGRQLSDVGIDPELELRQARRLIDAGFDWLAVLSDTDYLDDVLDIGPAAICVMPRLPEFVIGFPSPRVRIELVASVLDAARARGLSVPVLGYGQEEEADRRSLWPKSASGLVVQPRVPRL